MIPQHLQYSADHEWVRTVTPDDAAAGTVVVRVGITDYAQNSLGDIVFAQLPEAGTAITAGESIGEVESTKSVSDIFAPVTGTVVARNDALDSAPELVNTDPFGEGWMFEVELADADGLNELLDADGYAAIIGES